MAAVARWIQVALVRTVVLRYRPVLSTFATDATSLVATRPVPDPATPVREKADALLKVRIPVVLSINAEIPLEFSAAFSCDTAFSPVIPPVAAVTVAATVAP